MQVQKAIEEKLTAGFEPIHLEVVNESHMHNVPPGSESHFKVTLVSDAFEGKPAIARHRLVNKILADELANKIHALTMTLLTPDKWGELGGHIDVQSPRCMGGGRHKQH